MTINNVTLGDKFISQSSNVNKRVSTVVDFIENKSLVQDRVISHTCIAENNINGQLLRFEVAFATVVRGKIK